MSEKVTLEWSSAEVSDGTLVVALSERPPKNWRDAFERATALLSHGSWTTRLSQRNTAVRLDPVELGQEERVRQFLEGALLEANRTIVSEDELFEAAGDAGEPEQAEVTADEELTQRFRAFAR